MLGDGWQRIGRSPEEVAAAVGVMDQLGRKQGFRISVRTQLRIGETARDPKARAALRGSADVLASQVERYSEAGVHQLVLEPDATELDDFPGQLARYSSEVAPRFPGRSRRSAP